MKWVALLAGAVVLSMCSGGTPANPPVTSESTTSTTEASSTSSSLATTTTQAAFSIPDLSGVWDGVLEGQTRPQQGTVLISQEGNTFSLQLSEGFDCSPPEACDFEGVANSTVDDQTGTLVLSWCAGNSGAADNEGGTYESEFCLQQSIDLATGEMIDDSYEGPGHSKYEHPDGSMEWDTYLTITRRG